MDKKTQETYSLKKSIGSGASGEVFLVQSNTTSQKYALKRIKLLSNDFHLIEQYKPEIKALNRINNVHVIRFKETFISMKPKPCLNIITEYVDGCDLSQEIATQKKTKKPFSQYQLTDWIIQISLGLDAIHSVRVIHRDIKPSNIFLTKDKIAKIGDFGIARCLIVTLEKTLTFGIGTPYYIAPEMLSEEEGKGYTYKVDMWSFGVSLYEMITFNKPFDGRNFPAVILKIIAGKYKELPKNVPQDLRNLVNKLLKMNPDERYSAKDILKLEFIQQRMNYLISKKNLKDEVVLPKFKEVKQTPFSAYGKKGSHGIKLNSNNNIKSNNETIQPNTNERNVMEINDTVNTSSPIIDKSESDITKATSFDNLSDNTCSDMQKSILLMSQITLHEDNDTKDSTVKSTKSDNTLRYKGLNPLKNDNNNDKDICNVDCDLKEPENKVKGFNETCKGLSMSMNNNMNPNETKEFVNLRECLVKSIGEEGFKKLCNLSVLVDVNQKEKFKNDMKTKFMQENKTKTEITNELKNIDQLYSYGEPI